MLYCKSSGSPWQKPLSARNFGNSGASANRPRPRWPRCSAISPGYVNLLENNQRSLSVRLLMALADAYQVDWRDIVSDETSNLLGRATQRRQRSDVLPMARRTCRNCARPSIMPRGWWSSFSISTASTAPRSSASCARAAVGMPEGLLTTSAEAVIHDFFRDHSNYFDALEVAAEKLRVAEQCEPDDIYAKLKARLFNVHGIRVKRRPVEEMTQALRVYDRHARLIYLSEALDHVNQVFQLAHVLCLVELQHLLDELTAASGITEGTSLARCNVELANYFAAAFLMPYEPFLQTAESTAYDIDRISARFGVSFEQACHRLTTLQRPGAQGVPFFFLRVDKAGNVTKRFNSTSFHLAEYGGACPVWNIHMAFRTPGVILPQFVELPDGDRFFTISRTADRPAVNFATQDHRLAVALGCELRYASKLGYASSFNLDETIEIQPDRHQLPFLPAAGLLAARASAGLHGIAARHRPARQHPLRKLAASQSPRTPVAQRISRMPIDDVDGVH